jgi:hypothetical protein
MQLRLNLIAHVKDIIINKDSVDLICYDRGYQKKLYISIETNVFGWPHFIPGIIKGQPIELNDIKVLSYVINNKENIKRTLYLQSTEKTFIFKTRYL